MDTPSTTLTWSSGASTKSGTAAPAPVNVRPGTSPSPTSRPALPKGRPNGDGNRLKRLRAFELYASGHKKSEIANTLGVTKASVSQWSRKDTWNDRLALIANRAAEASDHVLGETIADVATRIRQKYDQRLRELDQICTSPLTPANSKISAIKAWFELGLKVTVDPLRPLSDPRNLEMIQDLLETTPATPTVGASDIAVD